MAQSKNSGGEKGSGAGKSGEGSSSAGQSKEGKGGQLSEMAAGKGTGGGPGGGGQSVQGTANPTGQQEGKVENARPGDPKGEPSETVKDNPEPDRPKSEADPKNRNLAGSLRLEDIDKLKKNKKLLKDLKLSEKDLEEYRKTLVEKLQAQPSEKLPPPGGGGNLANLGAREIKRSDKADASNARRSGLGQPPPEFRDLFRQYTSGSDRK
jgi:hypothetical protein